MKKLVNIIKIAEVNECESLETDYKIEQKNLKRYQGSLKLFRVWVLHHKLNLEWFDRCMSIMCQNNAKNRKKKSEVEYFMCNGMKMFNSMVSMLHRNYEFYGNLYQKVNSLEKRVTNCLNEQKKKYLKHRQQYQKEVKAYTFQCYPQTNSILFKMGLMNSEQIHKKGDSFKETVVIQTAKKFTIFFNQCLNEIQSLKNESIETAKNFYQGGKNVWIDGCQQFKDEIEVFEVDEEEMNKVAQETGGGANTDRSSKSNDESQYEKDKNEEGEPQPAQND